MKILHLIDIPWWSGLSSYAFDCIEAHLSMGHEVRLLCEKDSLPFKRVQQLGIKVTPICSRKFWVQLLNFLMIGAILARERFGCIVAHTGSTHWMACVWGKMLGIPIFRTRAIAQGVKSGFLNRAVYQATKMVVAASLSIEKDFAESFPKDIAAKVHVLFPPVKNPDLESLRSLKAVLPKNFKIGVLARLDPNKGHLILLSAQQILQKKNPEIELHIAGAEENLLWNEIVREAQRLRVRNLFYHGFLLGEDIWSFMRNCAIGVIGSLDSEEVSRALLEWMSAGRPVVGTRVGSIPQILEEGKGGFLVRPGDPVALAEKISKILDEPALAQKMGQHNLESVARLYTEAVFKAEWHKILYAEA